MNFATRNWIFYLFFFLSPFFSNSQCSEMGTRSGSVFSNDNSIGSFAFSSLGNILSSDNNWASASPILTLFGGNNTNYLKASGFGFTIPSAAVICGIKVDIEKSDNGFIDLVTWVEDNVVKLMKAGSITGNNKATGAKWSLTENYSSYGGIMDSWESGWTPAEINDPGFGIAFSAGIKGLLGVLHSVKVDHIRVTVYYNLVLPVEILSFTAKPLHNHSAVLQWSFGDPNAMKEFSIQRKIAGSDWITIHSKTLDDNSFNEAKYSFTDKDCSEQEAIYRIKIMENSGKIEYSKIVTVRWEAHSLQLYPNPASDHFYIKGALINNFITCINSAGLNYILPVQRVGADIYKTSIQKLSKGAWWIKANDKWILFQKQ